MGGTMPLCSLAGLASTSILFLELTQAEPRGAFRGVEMLPAGDAQTWAVIADLDGDAFADAALLQLSGGGLTVYLNREGGLERRDTTASFDHPLFVGAGRADGDEHMDLAVGFRQGAAIFFGNGD